MAINHEHGTTDTVSRLRYGVAKVSGAIVMTGAALLAGCSSSSEHSNSAISSITVTVRNNSAQSGSHNPSSAETPPTSLMVPGPGPAVLLPGSHHEEVEQFGAETFTDYTHAYGPGTELPINSRVDVDCVATGPVAAAPSAKGKWYHIEGPLEYAGFYIAANTFVNGDANGPLSSQPAVDPNVPACPPISSTEGSSSNSINSITVTVGGTA